jgi:hypothetical protein
MEVALDGLGFTTDISMKESLYVIKQQQGDRVL